jgi:cytochrome c-type biogenesis protein CcmH/NrfG
MKFKPVYFYGLLAIAALTILIIVGVQEYSNTTPSNISNEQVMPDDDVHKQLRNQGSDSPGKDNVSEEYKKRVAALEEKISNNPADTASMKEYADLLSASHKMMEALSWYEKILEVDPKRSDIYFSLALIYYNTQDFIKCEEVNDKVLSYDPKNQMALYNIGAIAATQGDYNKAKDFWNRVVSINSESETGKLAKESLGSL